MTKSVTEDKPVEGPEETDSTVEPVTPEQMANPLAPEQQSPAEGSPESDTETAPSSERAQVHVAPDLIDLATGRAETPEEKKEVKEQRDINQIVHSMLVIGLAVSTMLMLIGIALEIVRRQGLPTVEPDTGDVFSRVLALRPSGFLALGLLVLLATPILRVLGSVFAFAYERDWRFASITFLVLMIVIASILLGKG